MNKSLFSNVSMEDFGLGKGRAKLSNEFSMEAYEMAEQTAVMSSEVAVLSRKITRADFLRVAMESFDGKIDETTRSVIDFAMEADEEDKKDSDGGDKRGAIMTAAVKVWRWIKAAIQKVVAWFSKYYNQFVDFLRAQVRKAKGYFSKVKKLSDSDTIEFKAHIGSTVTLNAKLNAITEKSAAGEYPIGSQTIVVTVEDDIPTFKAKSNDAKAEKAFKMSGKEAKAAEKEIEVRIDKTLKVLATSREAFNKMDRAPVWAEDYKPSEDEVKKYKKDLKAHNTSFNLEKLKASVFIKEVSAFASALSAAAKNSKKGEKKDDKSEESK